MLDNTVFSLLTFLQIDSQVHVVDKTISDNQDILLDEAKRRKLENPSYKFVMMIYNLSDAKIV